MSIKLTLEEQETHLNMTADNRGMWAVYSDDPVMMRRLESIGAQLVREERSGGRHYELRADQVVLRKGKRQLSEAQRAVLDRARQLAADADQRRATPAPAEAVEENEAS